MRCATTVKRTKIQGIRVNSIDGEKVNKSFIKN